MLNSPAPVIVFAYNRHIHLDNTLKSLANNTLAVESDLYIFIDGPKNEEGKRANELVLKTAKKYQTGFFKSCTIKNHAQNRGLAKSIISGVTEIIERYGKVIVCEDDIISAASYLEFMNNALDYYSDNPKVFSVGGYIVPLTLPKNYTRDYIVTQRVSSMAWGIWKDRWDKIDWNMSDYSAFRFNLLKRREFNKWGKDRSAMLDDQMNGRVNSWAIRFDHAMFKSDTYNIVPARSLITSTGFDGTGTHCKSEKRDNIFANNLSLASSSFEFGNIETREDIRTEFNKFFYCSFLCSCKRFCGNLLYRYFKK